MLLILSGVLITATAVVSILRVRASVGAPIAHLGLMSEQWLAEHRAAPPS